MAFRVSFLVTAGFLLLYSASYPDPWIAPGEARPHFSQGTSFSAEQYLKTGHPREAAKRLLHDATVAGVDLDMRYSEGSVPLALPSGRFSPDTTGWRAHVPFTSDSVVVALMQLTHGMSIREAAQVLSTGFDLLKSISGGYVVRGRNERLRDLASLPFVRWIGPYEFRRKVSGSVRKLRAGDGILVRALYGDEKQGRTALERLGVSVDKYSARWRCYKVLIRSVQDVFAIAREQWVWAVDVDLEVYPRSLGDSTSTTGSSRMGVRPRLRTDDYAKASVPKQAAQRLLNDARNAGYDLDARTNDSAQPLSLPSGVVFPDTSGWRESVPLASDSVVVMLMQYNHGISIREMAQLLSLGLNLLQPIRGGQVVRGPVDGLRRAMDLPLVRWMGRYHPRQKISGNVRKIQPGDGVLVRPLYGDKKQGWAALERLGVSVGYYSANVNCYSVRVRNVEDVFSIASEQWVWAVAVDLKVYPRSLGGSTSTREPDREAVPGSSAKEPICE